MKFKVGDIVKGINNNSYGITNQDMYKGKIIKIRKNGYIDIKILDHKVKNRIGNVFPYLNPKYFNFVESNYSYEDLKKSPIGTKITFENGEVLVKDDIDRIENDSLILFIHNLKDFKSKSYGKIIKIEEPEYKTVYEEKKEILDKAEKRYLKFVIKPFRDNIKCVVKHNYIILPSLNKYYEGINIVMKDTQIIEFPFFKVDTMYKNMKIDKEYSLEELGL